MKQFLVFAGLSYYPNGGWRDFIMDFDTSDEAAKYIVDNIVQKYWDWWQIVDTVNKSIIKSKPEIIC